MNLTRTYKNLFILFFLFFIALQLPKCFIEIKNHVYI